MAVVVICAASALAQTTVTLGIPQSSANSWPFNFTNGSGRYQVAYGSSEINLAGGAQLTEVQVQITGGSVPTYNTFELRVAHTTSSTSGLTGTFASNHTGFSLQSCLGPSNYLPSTVVAGSYTYARFPLTTNFSYNGTNNLLIDFSYASRSGAGFTVSSVGTRSRVYANGGNSSTATGSTDTSGNWQVRLIFQTGPSLTVSATAGTAQNVYANDTGSGGNGILAGRFTVASNSQTGASLDSVTVRSSGTGNDSNAYSGVQALV
ncbi:MAG: hypothetical protein IPK87_13435 [Planctomycetes bacterium]|nr:hypothetical protein [Planctomycetota bacterium]